MSSNSGFRSTQEVSACRNDALDKLRSETHRHLRKYTRRIKADGEAQVRAAFKANPNSDPEKVADAALLSASQGQFLTATARKALNRAD